MFLFLFSPIYAEHAELPPQSFVTPDELELKLGKWLKNQKERFKEQRVALNETQQNKMLNIKVFKDWTETLATGTDKRKERYQKVGQCYDDDDDDDDDEDEDNIFFVYLPYLKPVNNKYYYTHY